MTLALLLIAAEVAAYPADRRGPAAATAAPTAPGGWGPADTPHCRGGGDRFAAAVVAVRKEYRLNTDRREADALDHISVGRRLFGLIIPEPSA